MTALARPQVVFLVGLIAVFGLGMVAGFVYAHEPVPAVIQLELLPSEGGREAEVRGSVSAVAADYIDVATAEGARRISMPPGTPIEALLPTLEVPLGARAVIGGNRTESGFVLTGIVVVGEP